MMGRPGAFALAVIGIVGMKAGETHAGEPPRTAGPAALATRFEPLPLGSIKPAGWLRNQLRIQADGLSGHLDETWADVGPNSGWLGGTGESWERGPYYLDGLIPLAWLLDDAGLKAKAQKYLDWVLTHQQANGMIGPASNDDWWPRFVILKALTQYHEATFFQHTNRGDVVFGHEDVQGPRFYLADELLECACGDALAPEVSSEPVADEPLITRYPAPNVPSHLALEHDGLEDVGWTVANLGPMGRERLVVPRRECGHAVGFGVTLVLEENGQIRVEDVAKANARGSAHA